MSRFSKQCKFKYSVVIFGAFLLVLDLGQSFSPQKEEKGEFYYLFDRSCKIHDLV